MSVTESEREREMVWWWSRGRESAGRPRNVRKHGQLFPLVRSFGASTPALSPSSRLSSPERCAIIAVPWSLVLFQRFRSRATAGQLLATRRGSRFMVPHSVHLNLEAQTAFWNGNHTFFNETAEFWRLNAFQNETGNSGTERCSEMKTRNSETKSRKRNFSKP